MAEETIDSAIKACNLKPKNGCVTPGLLLDGAHNYDPLLHMYVLNYIVKQKKFRHLVQDYGIDTDVIPIFNSTKSRLGSTTFSINVRGSCICGGSDVQNDRKEMADCWAQITRRIPVC